MLSMDNPKTTWTGVASLAILAGLVAVLAWTNHLNGESLGIVLTLAGAGSLNAIGNLFSKDADKR
jgi:hypothetical protein